MTLMALERPLCTRGHLCSREGDVLSTEEGSGNLMPDYTRAQSQRVATVLLST